MSEEQPLSPDGRKAFNGPVHKGFSRRFPAGSAAPPPPAPSPKHTQRMSRAAPGRLLQLGVFPQAHGACVESLGAEVGKEPVSSGQEGAEEQISGGG